MKKLISAVVLGGLALVIYYLGAGSGLMSSVLIGNTSFPDGTPKTREEALISTIDGFTLKNTRKITTRGVDNYIASYRATAGTFTAQKTIEATVAPFPEGRLDAARSGLVYGATKNAVQRPGQYGFVTLNGKNVFTAGSSGLIFQITWPTKIGIITIAIVEKVNIGLYAEISPYFFKITQAYMDRYPPIDAKDYASFGGNAGEFLGKFDLSNLPVVGLDEK